MSLAHISLGAEFFLMLAQVHRLCNAVLINAGIGSIGRSLYMALGAAAQRDLSRLVARPRRVPSRTIHVAV